MTTRIWLPLTLALLGDCATVYDEQYAYEQGWHVSLIFRRSFQGHGLHLSFCNFT